MKKMLSCFLFSLGLLALTSPAHAVWYKGTPKDIFVSTPTTGVVQITPVVSTSTVANNPNAAFMPGVLYQVILSSGASAEYYQLVDSTYDFTCPVNYGAIPANQTLLGPRLFYSSTTANTVITFDPPIRFDSGLFGCDSAVTGSAAITYELGRGISGQ
jgi:hypothetical protein